MLFRPTSLFPASRIRYRCRPSRYIFERTSVRYSRSSLPEQRLRIASAGTSGLLRLYLHRGLCQGNLLGLTVVRRDFVCSSARERSASVTSPRRRGSCLLRWIWLMESFPRYTSQPSLFLRQDREAKSIQGGAGTTRTTTGRCLHLAPCLGVETAPETRSGDALCIASLQPSHLHGRILPIIMGQSLPGVWPRQVEG